MARSMRLFLIRHGETVDNVAGLYAGIRDSELTNHGYQQATRLGQHFKALGLSFTQLWSSHLQRAAKTAGKIREAQLATNGDETPVQDVPQVVQLPLLVEQDFGSMEGKKFFERPVGSKTTGNGHQRLENRDTTGFIDMESKDSMAHRADVFLDEHLLPLLRATSDPMQQCVAIVSHGIFLSTLWKRLLLHLPPRSVVLSPELQATARPSLEHLGGWSNTGYLELSLVKIGVSNPCPSVACPLPSADVSSPTDQPVLEDGLGKVEVSNDLASAEKQADNVAVGITEPEPQNSMTRIAHGWKTTILAINGKDHLKGLKRTGGGVGSSRHDGKQKSIDAFFKRRKLE